MNIEILDLFRKIESLAGVYPNIINRINSLCTLYDKVINAPIEIKKALVISKLSAGATTTKEIYQETLIPHKEVKIIIEELINEGVVEVRYAPKQRGGQLKPGPKAKMFFIKERKD